MDPSSSFVFKRPTSRSSPALAVTGNSCPICLRHVDVRRAAVITSCMHAYCHGCLLRWTAYKRCCPLCNADFRSYYSNLNQISSRIYRRLDLSPPPPPPPPRTTPSSDRSRQRLPLLPWGIRRARREMGVRLNSRSLHLPRRRSFCWGNNATSDVIHGRILQWRVSIYEKRLRAVPLASRSFLRPNGVLGNAQKERIIKRIEPWIRRELHAILKDPDPTVIVHVAVSSFVSAIEKSRISSEPCESGEELLVSLRKFLDGWTDMFWHELRCFAESEFTMDTYDTVVEYKPIHSN